MSLISKRPLTPSQRFQTLNRSEVSNKRPEKQLTETLKKSGGRNSYGRITSRRRGGGHKRRYRVIDFKRSRLNEAAVVQAIEYDPNRSANIALVEYADGEKRYILAPRGLAVGNSVISSYELAELTPGNTMPLRVIPPAIPIHALELTPGRGAQMVRTAGGSAQIMGIEGDHATVKLPSGEIRLLNVECRATIGEVGNAEHMNQSLGKAGRNRWKGRRPRVRGVAMNPVDHPMGGGEGRTSGGGHPVSPWGQLSKGYPTRRRSKPSNSQILVRRNGKKVKN
jgi:large subunit ribosomal protein L2